MTTLTDFLLARIAEDEAGYRAEAAGVEWLTVNGQDLWPQLLAECEAKRRIVERAQRASRVFNQSINPSPLGVAMTMTMDLVLADLALPYANHDDYREEWKP